MAWAAAEARAEAEAVRAEAGEARATAKAECEAARKAVEEAVKGGRATEEEVAAHVEAVEAFERDFTAAELTPDEEMRLERLREEANWSEAEELHLERLRAVMKEAAAVVVKRQLQQAEEKLKQAEAKLQQLSLQTQSAPQTQSNATSIDVSGVTERDEDASTTPITPAPTPVPAANAALRAARDERERRAPEGGVEPPRSGRGAAPSSSGGVATLADLPSSEEQEDHCAICGGIDVQGVNELVRCGFGDGRCVQEPGDAPRRACWHAACEPELHGKQGQRVVCARHEKDARFKLNIGTSQQA